MSLYLVGRGGERISMRGLLTTLHLIAFTVPLAYCKNQALIDSQGENLNPVTNERKNCCCLCHHGSP